LIGFIDGETKIAISGVKVKEGVICGIADV
jgi:hypothetical protein